MNTTRFSQTISPAIIGVVRERTIDAAIEKIKVYEKKQATVIDLHLSCLDDEYKNEKQIKRVVEVSALPILALNYNQRYDRSEYETTEEERVRLLMCAVRAGVSAIDMQGYTFDLASKRQFNGENKFSFTYNNPFEIITDKSIIEKQKNLIKEVHSYGKEVVLSTHPYIPMDCQQVIDLVYFLAERDPDVIKIVTRCLDKKQLLEAFKTMVELEKLNLRQKISFHCCDALGKITRLVNPLLGSFMCFCSADQGESRNKEQLDIDFAVNFFNEVQ